MPLQNYISVLKDAINDIAEVPPIRLRKNILGPGDLDVNDAAQLSFTGTICDLTAYAVVACAVGVDRIEKLKTLVAGEAEHRNTLRSIEYENTHPRKSLGGDEFYLFRGNQDADRFEEAVTTWMQGKKAGAAQFKFDASGWHTFAVIRLPDHGGFLLYQSYQGTYRLCDFLERDRFNGLQRETYTPALPQNMLRHLNLATAQIATTAEAYGRHKVLTSAEFKSNIVQKFKAGMNGGMLLADYVKLSGHWTLISRFGDPPKQQLGSVFFIAFDGLQITPGITATRLALAGDTDARATAPVGTD